TYLRDDKPGCSQEKTKSVMPGNIFVDSPIKGANPNPMILNQNSAPSSPGLVLVTWLSVASRCISAYTFTITAPVMMNRTIKIMLSACRGSKGYVDVAMVTATNSAIIVTAIVLNRPRTFWINPRYIGRTNSSAFRICSSLAWGGLTGVASSFSSFALVGTARRDSF